MSSFIFENNKIISFSDYCLSESIKPKEINYGTNNLFNNSEFIKIGSLILTSFEFNDKVYTVINSENDIGFHALNKSEINYLNFNYIEEIQKKSIELTASNAIKIFSFVFFIIKDMIKKYNLTIITFDGENVKLSKMYDNLIKNKFFIEEMKNLKFEYCEDSKNKHTFKHI